MDVPRGAELQLRSDSVVEVIYLLFNEGYSAHAGDDLVRHDLCGEALRLGRLVAGSPHLGDQGDASAGGAPAAHALVALMAFQAARLAARVDGKGELVLLEDQNRSLWDQRLLALGFAHFERCADGRLVTPYHVQAAIASVHARAAHASDTEWEYILRLYDDLYSLSPSPIVALNRAVALSKVTGPAAALAELGLLADEPALGSYYLLPSVMGQLHAAMGDHTSAAACYRAALARPCTEPERRFLERRLAAVEPADARTR
jgi:RNA polymerase sigma-70 factor (ECF subfamily)